LRKRSFWYGPVIMVMLGAPWQVVAWRLLNGSVNTDGSLFSHALTYAELLGRDPGPLVLLLATVGSYAAVAEFRVRNPGRHIWLTAIALVLAVLGFHAITPIQPDIRYVFGAMAPIVLLAAKGIAVVARAARPSRNRASMRAALLCAVVGVVFVLTTFKLDRKGHYGFRAIASAVVTSTSPGSAILTSSSFGDGMLIAELAMLENPPARFVLRADKVLSSSTWDGYRYELKYRTTEAVQNYLAAVPVDAVLLDEAVAADADQAHHELLRKTLNQYCGDWSVTDRFPIAGRTESVLFFHVNHPNPSREKHIEIDMKYSLGRTIGIK